MYIYQIHFFLKNARKKNHEKGQLLLSIVKNVSLFIGQGSQLLYRNEYRWLTKTVVYVALYLIV
jgi:hypothetical protein